MSWIEALLLGSMASAASILAIAGAGFAMLAGRLPLGNGIRIIIGCFLIFGAPLIAGGAVRATGLVAPEQAAGSFGDVPEETGPVPALPAASVNPFDPYVAQPPPRF